MNNRDELLEENIKILIQQDISLKEHPTREKKQQVLKILLSLQQSKLPADFPEIMLVCLVAIIFVLAIWLSLQIQNDSGYSLSIGYSIMFALISVNLIWIPLTGLTILILRRFYGK